MKTRFFPIAGAILNIFFFGLPDLLVGQIVRGILKLGFEFVLAPVIFAGIHMHLEAQIGNHWSILVTTTLTIGLLIGFAIDGYKTFQAALQNPNA